MARGPPSSATRQPEPRAVPRCRASLVVDAERELRRIDCRVRRVVVRDGQQVAHDVDRCAPAAPRSCQRVDGPRCRAAAQRVQAGAERRHVAGTKKSYRHQSAAHAPSMARSTRTCTAPRACHRSAPRAHAAVADLRCSRFRRRPAAPASSAAQRVPDARRRTAFCRRLRLAGHAARAPSRGDWPAPSRSSTCAPRSRRARAAARLLPEPVGLPQTTRRRSAPGSCPSVGDDGAPVVAVAAFEHLHAKADLVEHQRERLAALGRRASSRRAATSRAAAQRTSTLDVARRCCATTSAAPRLRRGERRVTCSYCGADVATRSASVSARPVDWRPGRWSSANSLQDRDVRSTRIECRYRLGAAASRRHAVGQRQSSASAAGARPRARRVTGAIASSSSVSICELRAGSAAAPSRRSGRCPRHARRAS